MEEKINVQVSSEIGELEAVILHTPGSEVENMTPQNAERALYSDILNLTIASKEYNELHQVLNKLTKTFQVKDLLHDILENEKVRESIIHRVVRNEQLEAYEPYLLEMDNPELARQLIEGGKMIKNNLTRFLDPDRYSLNPLHNFFFTRDASMTVNDKVLIAKMASKVRDRESLIRLRKAMAASKSGLRDAAAASRSRPYHLSIGSRGNGSPRADAASIQSRHSTGGSETTCTTSGILGANTILATQRAQRSTGIACRLKASSKLVPIRRAARSTKSR